uniref:Uncharacterized protein n=4 Tax=Oryza TaxID=4527 RepID=A0A0E0Q210_ORYRU|nr:uncharacterized protein LOC112939446 [Oryza sativa Japonica Group]
MERGKAAFEKEYKSSPRRRAQGELIRRAKRRLAASPLQLRAVVVGGGALSVLAGGSREPSAQMGHGPRRLVSGAYAMPPWVPIEVKIDQKWKRAFVLRQADHRGLCLVRVTGTPDAEPVMVPLSTIRLPSRVHRAKRRPETAMQIQVKKARIEQSSDDEE